jgi:hypothetical protein
MDRVRFSKTEARLVYRCSQFYWRNLRFYHFDTVLFIPTHRELMEENMGHLIDAVKESKSFQKVWYSDLMDFLLAGGAISALVIGSGLGLLALNCMLLFVPIYFLWNWLMPTLFQLPRITLIQSLGLILLARLLLYGVKFSLNFKEEKEK